MSLPVSKLRTSVEWNLVSCSRHEGCFTVVTFSHTQTFPDCTYCIWPTAHSQQVPSVIQIPPQQFQLTNRHVLHHCTFSGATFPGNTLAGKVTLQDITGIRYEWGGNDFDRTDAKPCLTHSQVVVFVSNAPGCWLALLIVSGAEQKATNWDG